LGLNVCAKGAANASREIAQISERDNIENSTKCFILTWNIGFSLRIIMSAGILQSTETPYSAFSFVLKLRGSHVFQLAKNASQIYIIT
jgi:hypothetical protein